MPAQAPGRYWVIRYPSDQGAIVAKFDTLGETQTPDEIADYGNFKVLQVADRSALTSATVDQSGLSESEIERLSQVARTDV